MFGLYKGSILERGKNQPNKQQNVSTCFRAAEPDHHFRGTLHVDVEVKVTSQLSNHRHPLQARGKWKLSQDGDAVHRTLQGNQRQETEKASSSGTKQRVHTLQSAQPHHGKLYSPQCLPFSGLFKCVSLDKLSGLKSPHPWPPGEVLIFFQTIL